MKRRALLASPSPSSPRSLLALPDARARIDIYAVLSRDVLCVTDRPKSSEETESRADVNRSHGRASLRKMPAWALYAASMRPLFDECLRNTSVHNDDTCTRVRMHRQAGSRVVSLRARSRLARVERKPEGFHRQRESRRLAARCRFHFRYFDENGGSAIPPFSAEAL